MGAEGVREDEEPSSPAHGPNISVMEADFHTKSKLSLASWGSLWYENRANPPSSDGCHVFILPTRCPFINLWLILALCLKRLELNGFILDCCSYSSKRTCSVSHRSFKVLKSTTVTLCNTLLAVGTGCAPLHPPWRDNTLWNSNNTLNMYGRSWPWQNPWCLLLLTTNWTLTLSTTNIFKNRLSLLFRLFLPV